MSQESERRGEGLVHIRLGDVITGTFEDYNPWLVVAVTEFTAEVAPIAEFDTERELILGSGTVARASIQEVICHWDAEKVSRAFSKGYTSGTTDEEMRTVREYWDRKLQAEIEI